MKRVKSIVIQMKMERLKFVVRYTHIQSFSKYKNYVMYRLQAFFVFQLIYLTVSNKEKYYSFRSEKTSLQKTNGSVE